MRTAVVSALILGALGLAPSAAHASTWHKWGTYPTHAQCELVGYHTSHALDWGDYFCQPRTGGGPTVFDLFGLY